MPAPARAFRVAVLSAFHMMPLLLGLVLATGPIAAQDPPQRAELERFRDSLARTADSVGLLAVEKRMIEQAKADRNNPMVHLRLGFLSLRIGELGGQSH